MNETLEQLIVAEPLTFPVPVVWPPAPAKAPPPPAEETKDEEGPADPES
jgi:hypothetical protein